MKPLSKMTRRDFMAAAGGSVVSIGLPGVFVKLMDADNEALAAELRPDGQPRIPPGQHAVKTLSDMGGVPGIGHVPEWLLDITGAVKKPLTLTFAEKATAGLANLRRALRNQLDVAGFSMAGGFPANNNGPGQGQKKCRVCGFRGSGRLFQQHPHQRRPQGKRAFGPWVFRAAACPGPRGALAFPGAGPLFL